MRKDDVISYFGSVGNVAKALDISHASVSGWGNAIPKGRAFEIQALTDEKLKVDPMLYIEPTHSTARTQLPKEKQDDRANTERSGEGDV